MCLKYIIHHTLSTLLIHCRSTCSDDGTYIVVYAGYNEVGVPWRLCNSSSYTELYTSGSYAYIKFYSNSGLNCQNLTGFSKIEFTALGMVIVML